MKPQLQSTHTQLENPAPTELGFVLDRSSSMQGLAATMIAAFNTLLVEQRKLSASAGRASLLLFSDACESVFDGHPLATVSDLTATTYQPSGSTALWDGMGAMIEQIGTRFDAAATPPRVLIVNDRRRGECLKVLFTRSDPASDSIPPECLRLVVYSDFPRCRRPGIQVGDSGDEHLALGDGPGEAPRPSGAGQPLNYRLSTRRHQAHARASRLTYERNSRAGTNVQSLSGTPPLRHVRIRMVECMRDYPSGSQESRQDK